MSLKLKRGTKDKIESALSDAMAQLEIEESTSDDLKKKEVSFTDNQIAFLAANLFAIAGPQASRDESHEHSLNRPTLTSPPTNAARIEHKGLLMHGLYLAWMVSGSLSRVPKSHLRRPGLG